MSNWAWASVHASGVSSTRGVAEIGAERHMRSTRRYVDREMRFSLGETSSSHLSIHSPRVIVGFGGGGGGRIVDNSRRASSSVLA